MSPTPFSNPSTLPYELPPFAEIADQHYLPAFEEALLENRAEFEAILGSGEPTFENTVVALERAGRQLSRVLNVFYNKQSSDTNSAIDAADEVIAPKFSAHLDSIRLNPEFFARLESLFQRREQLGLDAESKWLLERNHREFSLAGAGLSAEDRSKLQAINEELSTLSTQFGKALLADTNDLAVLVEDVSELAGLSDNEIAAAAAAAESRGLDGKWLLTMVNYTGHPALTSLKNRALRKKLVSNARIKGNRGNANDTKALLIRMVQLRAQRARLLGFKNHAEAVTIDETAGKPENVHAMLRRMAPAARANAEREAELLADAARAAGDDIDVIEAHDWDYYADQVRLAKFNVDTGAMRPYFELERTLEDGVFFAASKLFGIEFKARPDLQAYHPDARVWEVTNTNGSPVGLYVGDFYTRDSKRGGAWMNNLVDQSFLLNQLPVVVNNLNVPKPPAGEPTLLTFDEAFTLFHEFGHAIHGLFSQVTYPHFSGTSVHRDFVEFPSQVNEMWMLWPEVLSNYARHFQTGEPMPQDWVDNLKASLLFNQGHDTVAYLAAAILDLAWHELTVEEAQALTPADVEAFEVKAIRDYGLDFGPVPTRYRSTYFSHIFDGGYSAGYYGYIWSEILDADTVEWFKSNGGLTLSNGLHFRDTLLSRGGSKDAMQLFRDFRGQDAQIEPLLRRRGLLAE